MNLFRTAVFALSVVITFSIGPSSSATTDYSHPSFSVADDRTLSLRETGSKIVMETIEDAVRQGGLALFGEGFQLDSSLGWVFGETIEGEIDAVVPLWNRGGHVVFTQPGLVFWTGVEEEERADGNLGLVYRAPVGFNAIGGASVFYDRDFQAGHSRISFGADIQRGYLQGSANYYHPLGDEEEGRTGYIEEALRGMDARLVYERSKLRVSGNLGYWKYGEIDGGEGDWELSYGLEAGVRIRKGVFVEAGYETHDDASIGSRFNLGVAFRFSLPGFEGASYGDGSRSANLYKIVEREKRILYEEADTGPAIVSFRVVPEGQAFIADTELNAVVTLSKPLKEDVTLNVISSGGTAVYGVFDDWDWSYRVPAGEGNYILCVLPCPITFAAGQTIADIRFTSFFGSDNKTIITEIEIPTESESLVELGDQTRLNLAIEEAPPLARPTASLNYSGDRMIAGTSSNIRMRIDLSEALNEEVTVSLHPGGTATYANDGVGTWNLVYHVVPANQMPGDTIGGRSDCPPAVATSTGGCQIVIPAGQTIVDIEVAPEILTSGETIELRIGINDGGSTGLALGNSWRQMLTVR